MGILSAQSPPYIPAFRAPALSHLLRSKERARTLQAGLTPTSSSFCPHFTNSFCEQMKWLRPKKKRSPCGRKKTFFRRAKNFRAHAGKFLCAQKNIFVRTQFFSSAEGSKFSSAERFLSLREELPLRAKETSLVPPRTPAFELRWREKQSPSPSSICDRRGACSWGKIQR